MDSPLASVDTLMECVSVQGLGDLVVLAWGIKDCLDHFLVDKLPEFLNTSIHVSPYGRPMYTLLPSDHPKKAPPHCTDANTEA